MFACFFFISHIYIYIYIIQNRCNTRVTCSGFKVYIYDVTYVGLSLCIMFCGKLCIQTVSDENCERYGRHSGSKITLRLIARGWLPEGNLKNCGESLLRFLLCLLFMGQKTWRDMETAWTFLWLFTWHRNVGNLDLCLGISYFFWRKYICKMNRNRNKSKVWGVSHPERWSQTFPQRDLWSGFHGRILQACHSQPSQRSQPSQWSQWSRGLCWMLGNT